VNPEQLQYAKTHEWVHVEGEAKQGARATVGISAFAVESLTDLVHIELPEVGKQVNAGQSMSEVESVKAVSDIYAPVDGRIVEVNQSLADDLDQISQDPYGKGWIAKIEMNDPAALGDLLSYEAYEKLCREEQ